MLLPDADRAVVEAAKLRDYLLSPAHPVGRFKATFFLGLGYSQEAWQALAADIRRHATENPARAGEETVYGHKYEVYGSLKGAYWPNGRSRHGVDRPARRGLSPIRDGLSRTKIMNFQLLQTVVLRRELPGRGLREGDLGAVVHVYEPDGLEVEFVSASGRTEALVTLSEDDVRAVDDGDLITVRRFDRSA